MTIFSEGQIPAQKKVSNETDGFRSRIWATFYKMALLSFVVDFRNFCLLTFTAGGDSCGISVQADTPQKLCFEEDWRMPHGKRPPAVEINNSI